MTESTQQETQWQGHMSDEDFHKHNRKQIFVREASPSNWIDLSDELRLAAEALWAQNGDQFSLTSTDVLPGDGSISSIIQRHGLVSRPYMLLAGFSVETALKGLLVALDPSLVADGKLSRRLARHKLTMLADDVADLHLKGNERRLLEILERAIPYWGRYPIPKDWKDLDEFPPIGMSEGGRETFLALQRKLCQRTYDHCRGSWNSGTGVRSEFWSHEYQSPEDEPST